MGSGGGKKGAGKAMKGGKGKDGGKQGGTWTKEGDHGGSWIPTRAQLKGSYGGLPYPTINQYKHPWHSEGKGGAHWLGEAAHTSPESYPGFMLSRLSEIKTMSAVPQAAQLSTNGALDKHGEKTWLEVAGRRTPREVVQQNRFAPLQDKELTSAVHKKTVIIGKAVRICDKDCCEHGDMPALAVSEPRCHADLECCGVRGAVAAPADEPMPGETPAKPIRREGPKSRSSTSLATFIEKRAQHLRPLSQNDEWETIEAILDSGASVIVMPPQSEEATKFSLAKLPKQELDMR